jgi:hypothetical protein
MARILGLVLAVLAGTAAALLIGSGVTATYDGEAASCTTVINVAAVDEPPADTRRARLAAAACHDALVDRTELAGIAVLLCVSAATVATFAGRELQPT